MSLSTLARALDAAVTFPAAPMRYTIARRDGSTVTVEADTLTGALATVLGSASRRTASQVSIDAAEAGLTITAIDAIPQTGYQLAVETRDGWVVTAGRPVHATLESAEAALAECDRVADGIRAAGLPAPVRMGVACRATRTLVAVGEEGR